MPLEAGKTSVIILPAVFESRNMKYLLVLAVFASMLITACALPFGGAPLQQLFSTALQKSYELAREERSTFAVAQDKAIVFNLMDQFAQDDMIGVLNVSPYCYNGRVFLIGEYEINEEWARAVEITAREQGVRSITTYMLLKSDAPTCGLLDNFMLFANVRANLILDKDVESTNIDIKAVQCQIVLLGIVESSDKIDRAITHARSVGGVAHVLSFLEATRIRPSDKASEVPDKVLP
jgi:hyperosmotically inducible protein